MNEHTLKPDEQDAGARLDQWLSEQLPELSRARIQALIRNGDILVDGDTVRPSTRCRAGTVIEIIIPPAEPAEPLPENIPLDILFEDNHVIVINKPPGMVVHPAACLLYTSDAADD